MSGMINEQDVEDSIELDFELIAKENEEFRKIISQKDEMISLLERKLDIISEMDHYQWASTEARETIAKLNEMRREQV